MSPLTFEHFEASAKADGYDEVLDRQWAADAVIGTHVHAFDVRACMVQGDLWLTVGGKTRHLRAGDTFQLARDVPHSERYGPEGARFWTARRHKAAATPD